MPDTDKHILTKVAEYFVREKKNFKHTIFAENMPVETLYIIKRGEVVLKKYVHAEVNGRLSPQSRGVFMQKKRDISGHHNISIVGLGTFLGVDGFFDNNGKYKWTGQVYSEDCILYSIPKKSFMQMLNDYPKVSGTLTKTLKGFNPSRDQRISMSKDVKFKPKMYMPVKMDDSFLQP